MLLIMHCFFKPSPEIFFVLFCHLLRVPLFPITQLLIPTHHAPSFMPLFCALIPSESLCTVVSSNITNWGDVFQILNCESSYLHSNTLYRVLLRRDIYIS